MQPITTTPACQAVILTKPQTPKKAAKALTPLPFQGDVCVNRVKSALKRTLILSQKKAIISELSICRFFCGICTYASMTFNIHPKVLISPAGA